MPQRYGTLMALVTRFHSNALVERKHVLEAHGMRTTMGNNSNVGSQETEDIQSKTSRRQMRGCSQPVREYIP